MAEDNELEKRAVEELLRETDRARVRAETMGPTGWLKCPLGSTNKRFLLNTLRSTGTQQRSSEPRDRQSTARGRLRSDSPDRSRDRSRTPPRDHRSHRAASTDRKHHHRDGCSNKDEKRDRDRERGCRHRDNRDRRHGREGQYADKDRLHE